MPCIVYIYILHLQSYKSKTRRAQLLHTHKAVKRGPAASVMANSGGMNKRLTLLFIRPGRMLEGLCRVFRAAADCKGLRKGLLRGLSRLASALPVLSAEAS